MAEEVIGSPEPNKQKLIREVLMDALSEVIEGQALSVLVLMEDTGGTGFSCHMTEFENPYTVLGAIESIKHDILALAEGEEVETE